MRFTVIDIETTGLSKHYNKITEVAAVKVRGKRLYESYQTLVNPKEHILHFITRLTGIDNDMVKEAPTINQVLPSFIEFLGQDVFVAHNATFDFGFIDQNLRSHHNCSLLNDRLCTRKLANRLFPELPRKRLGDICRFLDIDNLRAHRALGDARATAEVFTNMLCLLDERGIKDVESILRFEKSPIKNQNKE